MDNLMSFIIGPQYGRCFDCRCWLSVNDVGRCADCKKKWADNVDAMKRAFEAVKEA